MHHFFWATGLLFLGVKLIKSKKTALSALSALSCKPMTRWPGGQCYNECKGVTMGHASVTSACSSIQTHLFRPSLKTTKRWSCRYTWALSVLRYRSGTKATPMTSSCDSVPQKLPPYNPSTGGMSGTPSPSGKSFSVSELAGLNKMLAAEED